MAACCRSQNPVAPCDQDEPGLTHGHEGRTTMADAQETSAQLVARLERLPFSRWHRNFFILAFCGIMFDAADFAFFGAALPPIRAEFGLSPAQAGLLATVGLLGA